MSGATGSSLVVVVGANGGSGASLVAGALSLAWARAGIGSWLVEMDLERADLGDAWGLPAERTLEDLAAVAGEIDAAHLRHAAHVRPGGPHVLLAPARPGAADAWGPEAIRGLLTAARVAAGAGGRVVVDGGLGLSPSSRVAAADADGVLVQCGPTVAAARRARRVIEALTVSGAGSRCGLVVAGGPGDREISARSLARVAGAPVLGEIPWIPREGAALVSGRWPGGGRQRLARAIEALAGSLP